MPEKGKITYKQLILLVLISRISITLTNMPGLTDPPANQDLWLSELLGLPIMLVLSVPVYLLWKRYPNQSIIQYSQVIAGKAGKLFGALYVWFFMQLTMITLYQYGSFMTTAVMPETPLLFFVITMVLFSVYAARNGIEVICRLSELLTPVIMGAMIIIALLLVKEMDFKALTPVLEKGWGPVLHGGFTISARTTEILGIAMLLPYLNDTLKIKRVFLWSYTLILIFFVIITIPILTTFGAELAETRAFPFFETVKLIDVGDFLERIEAIHMGIWLLGGLIKISFSLYLSVLAISQLLNLKDYKPIVLPAGILLIPLTILSFENIVELRKFTAYKIFTPYALLFILIIPLILLLISMIRKKGARQA